MVYANVRRFSVTALILTMFLYVIAPALSIETRAHADTAGLTLKFDFGTQTSPVAAGFNRVHESLLYSPSLGYGLDRAVVSRLRTGGDDLTNDFVLGTDYKFMADVPNGQYDVTVYSGDLLAGTSTTKTTVTLGGQTAGTIQSRQSVTSATYRTTVTGGQLVVGITGVGAGGYLNGLVIQQVLQAPPAPPAALSVTNIDPTAASPSVSLQWSSVTDAVYYHVYRAAGGSDAYQVIAETTATNYKDSGVAAGSSYSYKISALNASRQESALSQAVTADVKADPQLPAEPLPQSFPLKLDFGPGPAADGYLKVGATAYSPDLKYGFSDPAQVACFDRGTSDPLKSDFCAPAAGTSFNLDLPNGDYTITVTAGDEMSATDVAITAESIVKLPETSKSAGSYVEQSFDIALVDGQLNLTFTGTSPKINAIVVTKLPDRTPGDQPTVYIAGDSTVQTYDPYWRPQAGWGQMLPRFFDNQVLFNNKAIGGRSSKTFITEGRLDDILRQIRPNDYFFIQFGHNDATISIPERYASVPDYKNYLKTFVIGARQRGATPVLVTPMGRRSFDPNTGIFNVSFADYVQGMKEVADELQVKLVDLSAMSVAYYNSLGPIGTLAVFLHVDPGIYQAFPNGNADDTHFQEYGAIQLARMIAGSVKTLGLPLSANVLDLTPPADVPSKPTGLTATGISNASASLKWNAVDGADIYRIYRKQPADASFTLVGTSTVPSSNAVGLAENRDYVFAVSAVNGRGESAMSDELTVHTKQAGYKFDFGSASSPVADGYTQVTNTTLYTPERGYGLSAEVGFRDRGAPDDLTRDFVLAAGATFRVDLPNGQYNVKTVAGDNIASNRTTVSADGVSLGTLSSSAGQFAVLNSTVTVTNGSLNLTIGSNGRVNAIEITAFDQPDETPTGVKLTDNGGTVTLKNSKVSLTVNKTTAEISSLLYTAGSSPTMNLVGGTNGKGYYLANYSVGSTGYQKGISNAVFNIVYQSEERVEISMTVNDPKTLPFYLEVHMALEKDSPGMYYYTIYKYTDNMPDGLGIGQLRYAFALGDPSFTYYQVDDERGIQQRPTSAELNGAPKLQDATWLLPGGDISTGRVWTKYQNITNTEGDNHVFMASNGKVGVSLIQASKESFDGGPTKQELSVHDYYDGEILLWHEHTGHYGTPGIDPAKGWGKVYGPFYLYINQGSNPNASESNIAEMWSDAKSKAIEEQAKWPYPWIADPLYGASERSDVSGKLSITDGSSASGAWVVLSEPGVDFQTDTKAYVYSARADGEGNFTIRGVRPGTYTLTSFADGVLGEYKQENVTVGTATPLNLGTINWTLPVYGKLLWQIGTPDRSAGEFHVYGGDNGFRKHLTWLEYPYEFPNGVDFKVGVSDIKKDWNYFQPMFKTPGTDEQLQMRGTTADRSLTEWKIRFDSNGYTNGTGTLNIALASSVFGSLEVKLNGTRIAAYDSFPGPAGDNALYRQAIRGVYRKLDPIQFDASLIKKGENVITLTPYHDPQAPTSDNWMQPMGSIMYDVIRMEVDSDTTPPVTTDDAPGDWVNGDVTVHLTATDDRGVAHTYYRVNGGDYMEGTSVALTQDGKYAIEYYSVDKGGNVETVKTATVKIDKTAPVTTATAAPALPDGSSDWYIHPVTVSLSALDEGSGTANSEYSLDDGATWQLYGNPVILSADGLYRFQYRSTDRAGNKESPKELNVKLDQTAPVITLNAPIAASYLDSDNMKLDFAVTDAASGVDTVRTIVELDGQPAKVMNGMDLPLYTLPLGTHTISFTAYDQAGNSATTSMTFQTTASVSSLQALIERFREDNRIDNAGIANSLQEKLNQSSLNSFIDELNAQSGKHISSDAAAILLRDAMFLNK